MMVFGIVDEKEKSNEYMNTIVLFSTNLRIEDIILLRLSALHNIP